GLAAAGGPAGGITALPGIRGVAEYRALGGRRHGIFRRRRAAEDVDARRLEQIDETGALLHRHAGAQARAVLDDPALLVAEPVLDKERHAAERTVAEGALVEPLDAVGIKLDHGVERAVDLFARDGGGLRQLLRAHLFLGDELGQAEGVIGGIFGKLHG